MEYTQLEITPQLVHKNSIDDVLVEGFEPILPAMIEKKLIDSLKALISESDLHLINSLYKEEAEVYHLRHIPYFIDDSNIIEISKYDFEVKDFYELQGSVWILKESIIPISSQEILSLITLQSSLGNSYKECHKKVISILCENAGIPIINNYKVLNDTEHYFFYRKSHEHVPGLMLIEIARQAMYHYVYSNTGHKFRTVSISMSNLNVDFNLYCDSVYELELVVTQTQNIARKTPKLIDKTAYFYQRGKKVATIRLEGGVMNMKTFKRFRYTSYPKLHWFKFSDRISSEVVLSDSDGNISNYQLNLISNFGVSIKSIIPSSHQYKNISFFIRGTGFLTLPLCKQDCQVDGNKTFMCFDELSKSQKYALQEMIKLHCFINVKNITKRDCITSTLSLVE